MRVLRCARNSNSILLQLKTIPDVPTLTVRASQDVVTGGGECDTALQRLHPIQCTWYIL